jgi:hypothetical protein
MPTSARSTPTTTPKPAPSESATPAMAPAPPTPMNTAAKASTPGVTQPAGSRFRAPDAPTMAPRGTPVTPRRLDKTP